MDWNAVGAIGELLGALAVFITLVYLAIQIRQNTRTMEDGQKYARAQAYQARTDTALATMRFSDPEIMAATGGGALSEIDASRIKDLDDLQRAALYRQMMALMIASDNIAYQRQIGLLDEVDENFGTVRIALPIWKELGIRLRPSLRKMLEGQGVLDDD